MIGKTLGALRHRQLEQKERAGNPCYGIPDRKRFAHAARVLESLIEVAEQEAAALNARQERTATNIDQADYSAMRRRAERAEAELALFREQAPFVADALEQYAHALETGALDGAGEYLPEDVRLAIQKIPNSEVPE